MCLARIAHRGRPVEESFSAKFLQQLHEGYENLFRDWRQCPVVRINATRYDYRRPQDVLHVLSQIDDRDDPDVMGNGVNAFRVTRQ